MCFEGGFIISEKRTVYYTFELKGETKNEKIKSVIIYIDNDDDYIYMSAERFGECE